MMNKIMLLFVFICIMAPVHATEYLYPVQEDCVPIFGYHNIINDGAEIDHEHLEIRYSEFREQIRYATEVMGCRWMTFAKVMEYVNNREKPPTNACVLNFDDGHLNNYYMLNVLDDFNATASFFIITDRVGKKGYMDWDMIYEIAARGHEIGSHTLDSGGLVSEGLSHVELLDQIVGCRAALISKQLGGVTFAYPSGEWNDEIVEIVKSAGYTGARAIDKRHYYFDKTTVTISQDPDFIWHMYYYKPEQRTLQEISSELGYTGWWQFEDQYTVDFDEDNDVRLLSSLDLTETTYAVVDLQDAGDKISSLFILPEDDNYLIEIFAETGAGATIQHSYNHMGNIAVFIDGDPVSIDEGNRSSCVNFGLKYCCPIKIEKNLKKGVHKLTVQARSSGLKVDKFRIFSEHDHSFYAVPEYVHIDKLPVTDRLLRLARVHGFESITDSNATYVTDSNTTYNSPLKGLAYKEIDSPGSDDDFDSYLIDIDSETIDAENDILRNGCREGYMMVDSTCRDINECSANPCADDQLCVNIDGGFICRHEQVPSVYLTIYNSYPRSNNGGELLYSILDTGNIDTADNLLDDIYDIPTYEPVKLKESLNWAENPYHEKYWRFNFYNMYETRHLLYAYKMTGNEAYIEKLKTIINGFIDNGMNSSDLSNVKNKSLSDGCDTKKCWYVWDYHTTAHRTLVLINTWWKLREEGLLDYKLNRKLLNAMAVHGDFLMDNHHFELGSSHGITEAFVLYVLAVNFPDLPHADDWYDVSKVRIKFELNSFIDEDGVLVEDSSHNQFYVLKLFWNICKYLEKQDDFELNDLVRDKLDKMISYGTYILQPNLEKSFMAEFLKSKIRLKDEFIEMANANSDFLYVLTRGANGTQPESPNVHYPVAGQTIMRSGWEKGEDFKLQTQLIFDVGSYKAVHSDLDALSFQLFGDGILLLPDVGLYSYEKSQYTDYFHGTSAHNTVVVDGKDQREGKTYQGLFYVDGPVVYQSGQHILYDNVVHQRAVLMLSKKYILIIDNMLADENHDYDLIYHMYPDMNVSLFNKTVHGTHKDGGMVSIHPIIREDVEIEMHIGEENPVNGWCSWEYEKVVPCYSVSYSKTDKSTSFLTLIEVGVPDENLSVELVAFSNSAIVVNMVTDEGNYDVAISNFLSDNEKVDVKKW